MLRAVGLESRPLLFLPLFRLFPLPASEARMSVLLTENHSNIRTYPPQARQPESHLENHVLLRSSAFRSRISASSFANADRIFSWPSLDLVVSRSIRSTLACGNSFSYQFFNLLCSCAETSDMRGAAGRACFLQPFLRIHSSGTPFSHYCALPVKHHNEDILLHIRRLCKKGILAYPLRFRNNMICSLFFRRSSISSWSLSLKIERLPFLQFFTHIHRVDLRELCFCSSACFNSSSVYSPSSHR